MLNFQILLFLLTHSSRPFAVRNLNQHIRISAKIEEQEEKARMAMEELKAS